ncbi:hypothetical protein [Microbacterium allomyrinae]|uniref:Uncharacterized protein n=1 Tax=Microbacterium allomyrinae TaxID=2830666 RepID=A0A9X1S4G6_9MICO|nr:hypothetical protein [Microbacterium allomyrinae]MCC2033058.1 hypothetical protein [Microbacterium allomyrinae]
MLYGLRAALYLMCLLMGVGAVWLTPTTVSDRLPGFVTDLWGVIAVLGALACLGGALSRLYRWELIGLPLVIGAVVIYAITVWEIAADAPTRTAQASAVTALLFALGIRWIDLLVVRGRLVRENQGGG